MEREKQKNWALFYGSASDLWPRRIIVLSVNGLICPDAEIKSSARFKVFKGSWKGFTACEPWRDYMFWEVGTCAVLNLIACRLMSHPAPFKGSGIFPCRDWSKACPLRLYREGSGHRALIFAPEGYDGGCLADKFIWRIWNLIVCAWSQLFAVLVGHSNFGLSSFTGVCEGGARKLHRFYSFNGIILCD